GMKTTTCAKSSAIPGAVGFPSTSAKLAALHRCRRLFLSVVSISAVLTSGCQTFNMSPEKFAEQQKGHYDDSPEARTVEVAGYLLYFLHPLVGCHMPDSASEP